MTTFEKPILILDKIIYPNNLFEIIKKQNKDKKFIPEFFSEDYIRVITICDENEERLDEVSKEIQKIFYSYVSGIGTLIIDNESFKKTLLEIEKQLFNGIPEKNYNDWFMCLAFQMRQIQFQSMSSECQKNHLIHQV